MGVGCSRCWGTFSKLPWSVGEGSMSMYKSSLPTVCIGVCHVYTNFNQGAVWCTRIDRWDFDGSCNEINNRKQKRSMWDTRVCQSFEKHTEKTWNDTLNVKKLPPSFCVQGCFPCLFLTKAFQKHQRSISMRATFPLPGQQNHEIHWKENQSTYCNYKIMLRTIHIMS